MKRVHKVHCFHREVHFNQKQRLVIAFTGNTFPNRNQSRKGTEYLIVDKIAHD